MGRRLSVAALVQVGLEETAEVPLYRQLYEQLRDAILSRRVAPGARLPSTRSLSEELSVSRNTVMNAFEQLFAEGYVQGRLGAGTYVSPSLPEEFLRVRNERSQSSVSLAGNRRISVRGERLKQINIRCRLDYRLPRPFRTGSPAVDEFPMAIWERLASRCWREPPREMLIYGLPAGYRPLREAIANYLREARGVICEASQIIVTSGCQQALDLSARVLLDPGDSVWIEDPGYLGARGALQAAGARLTPLPVDDEGLAVAAGIAANSYARAVYVSPSHQFPLGVTMSLSRRLALLAWANSSNSWILEDDYDSEFRYTGRPITAIQGLDSGHRVIYIGSFSKVLLPAIRLGYMVVPSDLVSAFVAARTINDLHSPVPDQAVLAEFMREGHFARHIRRMRSIYAERQAVLIESVKSELGGILEVCPNEAGMHVVGWLPEGVDDQRASAAIKAVDIDALPLSDYAIHPLKRRGLLLGYAAVRPAEIRHSVARLATALRAFLNSESKASASVPLITANSASAAEWR